MDIRESIKQLAKGQGSYGRLDARLDEHLYKIKDGKQCSYTCWNKAKLVVDKPRASTRRRQG